MKRGEFYLVEHATRNDTKKQRVYLIVSRQAMIDARYSTVICAPVYTNPENISTEISVGIDEGLKHQSWVRCDELVSVRKSDLTNYLGKLSPAKLDELNAALSIALALEQEGVVYEKISCESLSRNAAVRDVSFWWLLLRTRQPADFSERGTYNRCPRELG
jgi:mRNA interferase MazF